MELKSEYLLCFVILVALVSFSGGAPTAEGRSDKVKPRGVRLEQCPTAADYHGHVEEFEFEEEGKYKIVCPCGTRRDIVWHRHGHLVPTISERFKVNAKSLVINKVIMEDSGSFGCGVLESTALGRKILWNNFTITVRFAPDAYEDDEERADLIAELAARKILEKKQPWPSREEKRKQKTTQKPKAEAQPLKVRNMPEFSESKVNDLPVRPFNFFARPAGTNFQFNCRFHYTEPESKVTWLKDGQPIDRGPVKSPVNATAPVLHLMGLTAADEGNYTCNVSNANGWIQRVFGLEIVERLTTPPLLRVKDCNTLVVGTSFDLICRMHSDPMAVFRWFYCDMVTSNGTENGNGTSRANPGLHQCPAEPKDNENFRTKSEVCHNGQLRPLNGTADDKQILKLVNVTYEDAGKYICWASNYFGERYATAHVRVVPAPEPQSNMRFWILLGSGGALLCLFFIASFIGYSRFRTKREQHKREELINGLICECKRIIIQPQADSLVPEIHIQRIKYSPEEIKYRSAVLNGKSMATCNRNSGTTNNTSSSGGSGHSAQTARLLGGQFANLSALEAAQGIQNWEYEIPVDPKWEIPRAHVQLGKILGEGAFGRVVQGAVQSPGDVKCTVAVKMLKEGHTDADLVTLIKELELMKTIGSHPNVINLVGACTQAGPLLVLVELAKHGNLRDFLRQHRSTFSSQTSFSNSGTGSSRQLTLQAPAKPAALSIGYEIPGGWVPLTPPCSSRGSNNSCDSAGDPKYANEEALRQANANQRLLELNQQQGMVQTFTRAGLPDQDCPSNLSIRDLIIFARQVACGMEYLAEKRCLHRDLAARNVLVGDRFHLKIADFGLAKDLHDADYYRKRSDGRIPVKWMAPEALFDRKYTTQSDVWSFGVLLWEIMTLGGTPYPSVPDVERLFQLLKMGKRMSRPTNCPIELYNVMMYCWMEDPKERPAFSTLVGAFDELLTKWAGVEEYLKCVASTSGQSSTSSIRADTSISSDEGTGGSLSSEIPFKFECSV